MKDFKEHFDAVHALIDGNPTPAEELFKKKRKDAKPTPPIVFEQPKKAGGWLAKFEEKQERDAEGRGELREESEKKP